MTNQKSLDKQDWRKRLKENWYLMNQFDQGCYVTCEEEVIDFIQSELDRQREEILGLEIMKLELQNIRTSYKKIFRNELRNEIKETINNLKKQ